MSRLPKRRVSLQGVYRSFGGFVQSSFQGLELLLELIEVVVQPQEMRMDGWWCMLPLLMGKRESPAARARVGLR
jgi:hypothetical protein